MVYPPATEICILAVKAFRPFFYLFTTMQLTKQPQLFLFSDYLPNTCTLPLNVNSLQTTRLKKGINTYADIIAIYNIHRVLISHLIEAAPDMFITICSFVDMLES